MRAHTCMPRETGSRPQGAETGETSVARGTQTRETSPAGETETMETGGGRAVAGMETPETRRGAVRTTCQTSKQRRGRCGGRRWAPRSHGGGQAMNGGVAWATRAGHTRGRPWAGRKMRLRCPQLSRSSTSSNPTARSWTSSSSSSSSRTRAAAAMAGGMAAMAGKGARTGTARGKGEMTGGTVVDEEPVAGRANGTKVMQRMGTGVGMTTPTADPATVAAGAATTEGSRMVTGTTGEARGEAGRASHNPGEAGAGAAAWTKQRGLC